MVDPSFFSFLRDLNTSNTMAANKYTKNIKWKLMENWWLQQNVTWKVVERIIFENNNITAFQWPISKLRHWNLGIGIEIGIRNGTDITNATFPVPQDIRTLRLPGWWFRMRVPNPQTHMRLQYCDHVTNKKRYTTTFTRPMDPDLTSVLT